MLLELQNVTKTFPSPHGEVRALDDICFSVKAGEFVSVQGPSGCGKSTLLLASGGLLAPDRGRVLLDGQDPYALSPNRRARFRAETVGFVFQQFHLIPYLTVLENVLAPAIALPAPEARQRAEELLTRFGLTHRIGHLPAKLSTGERQRVALARALLNRPRILLADEPTGNLDRENAEAVLRALDDFARDGGGVLLVTHDDYAAPWAQRALRIRAGRFEDQPAAGTL